jgi:hypothetical protein
VELGTTPASRACSRGATWHTLLADVGFVIAEFARPLGDGAFDRAFVGNWV